MLIRILISFVLFIYSSSAIIAQSSEKDGQSSQQEYVGEAAKLLTLFNDWTKASSNCDYDALRNLYHSKVSFWPSAAKEPFYGVDSTVEVFEGMCKVNPYLRVVPVERYVDLIDDAAVVFGTLSFRRILNEKLTDVPARFAFTFVKEKSEWKIFHMQSAVVPFTPYQSSQARSESKSYNQPPE